MIRRKELEAEYEANPKKRPLAEIMTSMDFDAFKGKVIIYTSEGVRVPLMEWGYP